MEFEKSLKFRAFFDGLQCDTMLSCLFSRGSSVNMLRLLVKLGAGMTCVDTVTGNTPLHYALAGGNPQMLVTFLKISGNDLTLGCQTSDLSSSKFPY